MSEKPWISVFERQPETDDPVAVWLDYTIVNNLTGKMEAYAYADVDALMSVDGGPREWCEHGLTVTHWQPIANPEGPQDDQ